MLPQCHDEMTINGQREAEECETIPEAAHFSYFTYNR